jgi:ATP-dependent helicase HrpB
MNNTLPIHDIRDRFVTALGEKNRIILSAPTGSGKSTQAPQYVLDNSPDKKRILVLQPRRLAARMLAARVAWERQGRLGGEIGFMTRFERAVSDQTRVFFITHGILPRMLLDDPDLKDVSTIIFDQFHERSLTTDLGLALVKQLQEKSRPDLKIIVMSATLDSGPLLEYLAGAEECAAEGKMFPVDVRHVPCKREDPPWSGAVRAAAELIKQRVPGDILIFMPGAYEIRRTVDLLKQTNFPEHCIPVPLFGDLPWEAQKRAMEPAQDRKVIVATNIAETSLTIPGVRHVIDSGLARISRYDPNRGFNALVVENISRAAAEQRAGRAGREDAGICVRLWSKSGHQERAPFTQPEVGRVDLSEAVLALKTLGISDASAFDWFQSPSEPALEGALDLLDELGALDKKGGLTRTGKEMACMPAHPRIARLLREAASRMVPRRGAVAAALLTERPVTMGKADVHNENELQKAGSDFEVLFYLIQKVADADFSLSVCDRLGINRNALRHVLRMSEYYLDLIRRAGLPADETAAAPASMLSQALVLAYPDRLARWRDNGTLQYVMRENRSGELARDSWARKSRLIIAAHTRELKNRNMAPKTILSMACRVNTEWLLEFFPDKWASEEGPEWNAALKCVEWRKRSLCLGVAVDEVVSSAEGKEKASALLAKTILEKNMKIKSWDKKTDEYLTRVNWLSSTFPEKVPAMERQDIIRALCAGEFRYSAVRDKEVLPVIKGILGSDAVFVEKMAPARIRLPSGWNMPVRYEAGKPPAGRARIQDLYDLKETPVIAGARVKLTLEILAPNNRPVQVTDDLAGFWKNHYPEIKKTLSRRYYKHEWR